MRTYTIINTASDAYATVSETYGLGTAIGDSHVVYSTTFPDLGPIQVDPELDPETGDALGPVLFNVAEMAPQELVRSSFFTLKEEQPSVFFAPVVEPTPEPRYKTKMTAAEFVRDVITQAEWAAVWELSVLEPVVGAWAYITSAGEVWTDHQDFIDGLALGVVKGIWTQARADEIAKGYLIQ